MTITFDKSEYLSNLISYNTVTPSNVHQIDLFNSSDVKKKKPNINFLGVWLQRENLTKYNETIILSSFIGVELHPGPVWQHQVCELGGWDDKVPEHSVLQHQRTNHATGRTAVWHARRIHFRKYPLFLFRSSNLWVM